jgi:hypothetical protein
MRILDKGPREKNDDGKLKDHNVDGSRWIVPTKEVPAYECNEVDTANVDTNAVFVILSPRYIGNSFPGNPSIKHHDQDRCLGGVGAVKEEALQTNNNLKPCDNKSENREHMGRPLPRRVRQQRWKFGKIVRGDMLNDKLNAKPNANKDDEFVFKNTHTGKCLTSTKSNHLSLTECVDGGAGPQTWNVNKTKDGLTRIVLSGTSTAATFGTGNAFLGTTTESGETEGKVIGQSWRLCKVRARRVTEQYVRADSIYSIPYTTYTTEDTLNPISTS